MVNTKKISVHTIPDHAEAQEPTLRDWIKEQALDLGFADCGFISVHNPLFSKQMEHLRDWLDKGYEGDLNFLHNNHDLREHPSKLVEGTKTIISVRMDYLTEIPKRRTVEDIQRPNNAIIARYARGRDYHKTMRSRLKQLAKRIEDKISDNSKEHNTSETEPFIYRPFSDSAPIFERAIADAAGLGWTGKHSLLINRQGGSFFVLGELFMSLEIEEGTAVSAHCGKCTACLDICPTSAIVEPYKVNASACISYLTIEHKGSIPLKYRKAIGNRIFGCDDCQLICPWNGYAKVTQVEDFKPRHSFDNVGLLDLWQWSEEEFDKKTQGSPIRRTGYESFLRNIAIGLGNSTMELKELPRTKPKRIRKSREVKRSQNGVIIEKTTSENVTNITTEEITVLNTEVLENKKQQVLEIKADTLNIISFLNQRMGQHSAVVDEHILWAVEQLQQTLAEKEQQLIQGERQIKEPIVHHTSIQHPVIT